MLFVGTSIIHPSTEGVFLLCNILDLLIYSSQDISLDELSEKFRISKTYINNLLKSVYHRSFLDILQDYRLKEAKKMILENQYKISEIAEKVGYHDISYFIRVFKKKYGVTPNNYGKY